MKTKMLVLIAMFFLVSLPSEVNAQTKKEMRETYKKILAEEKLTKSLMTDIANGSPAAAYQLALMYDGLFTGRSPQRDSAAKYLSMAVSVEYPEALFKYGEFYRFGKAYWPNKQFDQPNPSDALRYYQLAASKGYQPAIDIVKQYTEAGNHPRQLADSAIAAGNNKEALRLLTLAGDFNVDSLAMYKAARLYLEMNGKINNWDYTGWLTRAIESKYWPAAFELAAYEEESGYFEGAYENYRLAFTHGNAAAYEKSEECYKKWKDDELAKHNKIMSYGGNLYKTNQTQTQTETADRKKSCPICNGTGKITDRYTTENRDWNNKTITFTEHVTSKPCSRCNGSGYISY